jgi:hypothetical protein
MYRPNFCAECGEQIVRLKWRIWTSRKFCDPCAGRFRGQQIKSLAVAVVVLLSTGFIAGRAGRPASPPLVIERRENSPLQETQKSTVNGQAIPSGSNSSPTPASEERVYICGARTKKGTPCSRRVHGPVRCWQHKGMRALLPEEKLLVKEQP